MVQKPRFGNIHAIKYYVTQVDSVVPVVVKTCSIIEVNPFFHVFDKSSCENSGISLTGILYKTGDYPELTEGVGAWVEGSQH